MTDVARWPHSECDLCGATHYGTGKRCPYVEQGRIPGWVEADKIQAMRLAIQAHYAVGKIALGEVRHTEPALTDAARIEEIRERVEKAAPGKWFAWNAYGCAGGTHPADAECVHVARIGPAQVDGRLGIVADGGRGDLNGHRDDFQFIVHAREDMPWLLDQIAALTAEVDRVEQAHAESLTEWAKERDELTAEVERLREQRDGNMRRHIEENKQVRSQLDDRDTQLAEAKAELSEWEQTNELMRRREAPWIARWQQETGKADTLPDYGEMLAWLVGKADGADTHETLTGHAAREEMSPQE